MDPNRTPGLKLFEQVVKIKALPRDKEPKKPAEGENRVCRDNDVKPSQWSDYKTPLAMLDNWRAEQTRVFGNDVPEITVLKCCREWSSVAHLEIEHYELTEQGLLLCFSVTGDPAYMAQPSDLIALYLEVPQPQGASKLLAAVIEPTWDYNHWEIRIQYSLAQLAKILKISGGQKPSAKVISETCAEIGVRANWLGIMAKGLAPNLIRHESGGLDQKGGSGKLRLRPYSEEELKETETRRNTSWNMGEKLGPSRPVFQRYEEILQLRKEMLTTLECESEFKLSTENELDKVIAAMKGLSANVELGKKLRIVSVTHETKKYTDTYYDLPGKCDLLANRIVLRRRHRKTDEAGTFLFALKGATTGQGLKRLRLAAQVQLKETALGSTTLRRFLSFETVDNAFCRTLSHALEDKGAKAVISRLGSEDIVETLVINSVRETFAIALDDGTQIDFSADKATGTPARGSGSQTVYTFEFGLGHPALTQAATTGSGTTGTTSVSQLISQWAPKKVQIIRPYHVPADLTNPAMFEQADYKRFTEVRDTIMIEAFHLLPAELELGGTKAYDLAKLLSLI